MNHQAIDQLIRYGIHTGLIPEEETVYTRNLLLDILKEDRYVPTPAAPERELCDILGELTDAAIAKGLIPDTGGESGSLRHPTDERPDAPPGSGARALF